MNPYLRVVLCLSPVVVLAACGGDGSGSVLPPATTTVVTGATNPPGVTVPNPTNPTSVPTSGGTSVATPIGLIPSPAVTPTNLFTPIPAPSPITTGA